MSENVSTQTRKLGRLTLDHSMRKGLCTGRGSKKHLERLAAGSRVGHVRESNRIECFGEVSGGESLFLQSRVIFREIAHACTP